MLYHAACPGVAFYHQEMRMKKLAIASCRVSTSEQVANNSLTRQEAKIRLAAESLGVEIPKDGWWKGHISSKAGKNVKRKDLEEMLAYCKANRAVGYLIVDEPDRFMRSIREAMYWEVIFDELDVVVWYACDPQLNTGDLAAKLIKFAKYFSAEGSNDDRIRQSVDGHKKALNEGRYTFPPKPGYMKSNRPGVHIPHPEQFKPLQQAFKQVASRLSTPSEALRILNDSPFTNSRSSLKIDKFLHFLIDPYYYGVVRIGRQVNTTCEDGLHEPMITKHDHEAILGLLSSKTKRHIPKKQYNPEFPLNNLLRHDCEEAAVFTGSFHSNGKGWRRPEYRCRKCNKQVKRDDVHLELSKVLDCIEYNNTHENNFIEALTAVWNEKQKSTLDQIRALNVKLERIINDKKQLVRELARVDESLKPEFEDEIKTVQEQQRKMEDRIKEVSRSQEDLVEFISFSLDYTNRLRQDWWSLNRDERQQCQLLLFPHGITLNAHKKVGTAQLSPLYRLATNKKDLRIDRKSLMVELEGIAPSSRT